MTFWCQEPTQSPESVTHSSVRKKSKKLLKLKSRVWSKIIFCVWLAFAVKIVVAMIAELNLDWFKRYEPRKPHSDDVTAFSITQTRAVLYLAVSSLKVFGTA